MAQESESEQLKRQALKQSEWMLIDRFLDLQCRNIVILFLTTVFNVSHWSRRIVSVKSTVAPTTAVSLEGWTNTLAAAMDTFFDCQSYNTKFNGARPKVDWAFYGAAPSSSTCIFLTLRLSRVGRADCSCRSCFRNGICIGYAISSVSTTAFQCYNLILAWSLKPDAGKGIHAKKSVLRSE